MTITVSAEQGIGYRGRKGERAYVARITGSDAYYGLERTFIDADRVERDHWGRARYIRTYYWDLEPGLYERAAGGERWHIIVWTKKDGTTQKAKIDDARVTAIVRLLDAGEDYEAARVATRAAAAPAAEQVMQ